MKTDTENHAFSYSCYGGAQVLGWNAVPHSHPRPWECTVKVEAVSVNPVDWKIMAGEQSVITGRKLKGPRIFGSDFSGIVIDCGSLIPSSLIGKRVAGMVNPLLHGSGIRFLTLPARDCISIPGSMGLHEAAALPAAGISAWRLFSHRKPLWWQGRTVLLYGASGGVGHVFAQLAILAGAHIIALTRPENHTRLQALGMQDTRDYRSLPLDHLPFFDELNQQTAKPPVVVDCNGCTVDQYLGPWGSLLKPGQELAKLGGTWLPLSIANHRIPRVLTARLVPWRKIPAGITLAIPSRRILGSLFNLAGNKKIQILVDSVFDIDHARDAVTKSQLGHCCGKMVLQLQ